MTHVKSIIGERNYAVAISARHHALNSDESAELGGQDTGPNPYELLCSALGACTAITLRMYAARKGWTLRKVEVDVRFQRRDKEASIKRVLKFAGELDSEQRARLADIAERTPVTLTLKQGVPVVTSVEA
jgi:putative redox protein